MTSRGGATRGLGCSGGGAKEVGEAGYVVGVATSGLGCGEEARQLRSELRRSGRERDVEGRVRRPVGGASRLRIWGLLALFQG